MGVSDDVVQPKQAEAVVQDTIIHLETTKDCLKPAKIGFVGSGNMAQALLNGFVNKGLVEASNVWASAPSDRNLAKLKPLGVHTTHDNGLVIQECDIVFLSVKPHLFIEVNAGLSPIEGDHKPLFISIMTGISIEKLEQMLSGIVQNPRVVRTMPNTPCMVSQGCCVYCLGSNATDADGIIVKTMLSSVALCEQVPESQLDGICGLAGSGPAYIYAVIEALADGGVKMGIPRQLAQSMAAQMVKGAATMVLESGKHPGQLKDEVCSPGGTTITAMHKLETGGLRGTLMSAVEASAQRSKELGKHN
ncbi:unnamed protein product, partial [Meganyctiphanes norvegica]